MVRMDYYFVLGVPRGASEERIQQAFRRLAKEHHPDRVGPESTARFQEIAEAYGVLSDREKRRDYDRVSTRAAARRPAAPPRRPRVEPLVPEPLAGPGPWVEDLFASGGRAWVFQEPRPRRGLYDDVLLWMRLRGG